MQNASIIKYYFNYIKLKRKTWFFVVFHDKDTCFAYCSIFLLLLNFYCYILFSSLMAPMIIFIFKFMNTVIFFKLLLLKFLNDFLREMYIKTVKFNFNWLIGRFACVLSHNNRNYIFHTYLLGPHYFELRFLRFWTSNSKCFFWLSIYRLLWRDSRREWIISFRENKIKSI